MRVSTLLPAALCLTVPVAAWSVTSYTNIGDCDVHSDGDYRSYDGTDTKQCHDMAGADSSMTCRQFLNGGREWHDNCGQEVVTSGSVWIRFSRECEFFTDTSCRGTSKKAGGGECLEGAFKSFACVRILHLLLVSVHVYRVTRQLLTKSCFGLIEHPVSQGCDAQH